MTVIQTMIKQLPVIYENGAPKSVIVSIDLFKALLERIEEIEDEDFILNDPKILEGLREARAEHLAGQTISHAELISELGLGNGL